MGTPRVIYEQTVGQTPSYLLPTFSSLPILAALSFDLRQTLPKISIA